MLLRLSDLSLQQHQGEGERGFWILKEAAGAGGEQVELEGRWAEEEGRV